MQQLSALDAMFLYQELDNAPMHIATLSIYDPSTTPDQFVRFKDILKTFEDRLHLSPLFRRKAVHVPLELDYPYWIEDPNFDLEYHVRHIALPKPGDWRQLCIQVARLHARPLDLGRPLWEATVIEGLDNIKGLPEGSYAILTKIHHAAIDAVSGAEITAVLHDTEPGAEPRKPEHPWVPEREPTAAELLARTGVSNIRAPFRSMRVLSDSVSSIARIRAGLRSSEIKTLNRKPKTRFNAAVSPHRVFDGVTIDLKDANAIRKKVDGATVNDVILTGIAGGLRRYLEKYTEVPHGSIIAGAPINVQDPEGKDGDIINQMDVPIRTDIADPIERLKAVHKEVSDVGAYSNAVDAKTLADVTQSSAAAMAARGSRVAVANGFLHRFNPPFNCIITNVPGPQVPLYMGGAKLVRSYHLSPITEGMGLTHPVFSYCGEIFIAFQSDREMMPDPGFYAECLAESFDELKKAAKAIKKGKQAA